MKPNTKTVTLVGILAAMSAILYMFPTFPILPAFSWLEIDFADVPALIVSALVHPAVGAVVVLIRNLIHLPMSSTGMVGELSNFLISASFVFCAGAFFRIFSRGKALSFKKIACAMPLAVIVQVIAAVLCNKYIMLRVFPIPSGATEYILMGVVPFNLIKTVISSILFLIVFKMLIPKIRQYI